MRSPSMSHADVNEGVVVNGRYRLHRVTGVQRYAHEIVSRLQGQVNICTPRSAKGAVGHLWEQTTLPYISRGRLLWSPCGSGPGSYRRHLVTFHDLFPIEHPEWYGSGYSKWHAYSMRRLAAKALHLIAVSEYTKSRLVKVLGRAPEDITVIHNGCSREGPADPIAIAAAAHALKIPTRRYVLSLSSLESRKNIGSVLRAWSEIQQQLPADTWLVLAGKSDESVYARQNLRLDLPRVMTTGYVPEEHLAGLYSGASLFVFPSLAEGFGLPLLEAMACGVRCIASRTTSLPEVGGDVVEYIDPLDSDELARAMLFSLKATVLGDPFWPAVDRARRFTWDGAAAKTARVIDGLLSRDFRPILNQDERMAAL
jgi:glycosyltransferase involved in cell wall biosynthesis